MFQLQFPFLELNLYCYEILLSLKFTLVFTVGACLRDQKKIVSEG